MNSFDNIFTEFVCNPNNIRLKIKNMVKVPIALASYTTKNYPEQEYYKALFTDKSFMLILPDDQEFYFAENILGIANGIKDEDIGNAKILKFRNKVYELGNKNDYQFVKKIYLGSPFEIEGECTFSDYFPVSGRKEFLSLGWLSYSGERADMNPVLIDTDEITIE